MNVREAVIAFSQAEKIKSGIIALMHGVELSAAIEPPAQRGAERVIRVLLDVIAHETRLAGSLTPDSGWTAVYRYIEKAIVMANSGVTSEAPFHLAKALGEATGIASRAMTFLEREGVFDRRPAEGR